ncbi:MAG: hypothetical protein V4649_12265 [Bacteroidota bacterium]
MVTVDRAIQKGRIQLFWMPRVILVSLLALTFAGSEFIGADSPLWIKLGLLALFVLTFTLPLLYYFLMLPRWRIWAFSEVRNVHELKSRAQLAKIFPPEKSFLWRFEIKSAAQTNAIKTLEDRFRQPDIFEDDYSMPYQIEYKACRSGKILPVVLLIGFMAFGLYSIIDSNAVAVVASLFGVAIGIVCVADKFKATGPQLTISNDGITALKHGFHPWADIRNEQVIWRSTVDPAYYALSYEVNGETVDIDLSELLGSKSYMVDHVIRTYRSRYRQMHG